MAIKGDTVRFQVSFKGYDGKLIKDIPEAVHFKLYDANELELYSVTLNESNRLINGNYIHDFTFSDEYEKGIYTYEFKGVFSTIPYVCRDEITLEFS